MTNGNDEIIGSGGLIAAHSDGAYEIKIEGLLDEHWAHWFEGMTMERLHTGGEDKGLTILTGPIANQSMLHSLLGKIRDLNLVIISIQWIPPAIDPDLPAGPGK